MANTSPDIELTLLENGLDFICSAVEHLGEDATKRSLKYAVLNLASGIELIHKERLRQQSWELVFADPEKSDEGEYQRGNFKSVDPETALERLQSECGVQFEVSVLGRLRALRNKRNRIQHFNLVDSASAIIAMTADALGDVVDFIRTELSTDGFSEYGQELLKQVRTELGQLEVFVSVREKAIQPELKTAYAVLPCPACQRDALTIDDGGTCLFCGYQAQGVDAASDYATDVLGVTWRSLKDGDDWPVGTCPACDWDACVETDAEIYDRYLCFQCGRRWDLGKLDECGRCGRWFNDDHGAAICGHCFDELLKKD